MTPLITHHPSLITHRWFADSFTTRGLMKIRVAVVFGGRSGEHEVSLASAASIMNNMDPSKYEVIPVGITREGRWLLGGDPMRLLTSGGGGRGTGDGEAGVEPAVVSPARQDEDSPSGSMPYRARHLGTDTALTSSVFPSPRPPVPLPFPPLRVDVVFPVLHGPYGEDGTIQGLLEIAGVPYVGAGVLASAAGMDKAIMKSLFIQAGLPVVRHLVVMRREWEANPERVMDSVEASIGYVCFVKPANLGSSVGISKAADRGSLARALAEAASYDRKLIVEEAVNAREIECSVLGNDGPIASVPGEIVPSREFYDYRAKYVEEGSRLIIPAELPEATADEVRQLSISAFKAIDCAGMARVDFFVEKGTGRVLVNEINTIPGFTKISMYPKLWEASGLSYPALIDRLIGLALERHAEKLRNKTTYEAE